ncbi:AEC family transporter [Sphingomonas sp. CFBP8993]|uniref:AEC family transporter n=1 Tax=Sphingomonas sp. CFBP8993 TaxID=3096526 RepID=UPI002A6B3880|nr:AEC family transporter [Sphingomonas sp. CFBP8993]MDY0957624.1 AEC family transporter [Sphingomonas sp. CFBP8993]
MNGGVGDVLTQVLPLFGVILLAWGGGRWLPWASKLISALLVYGLIPLLVIDKVLRAEPAELAVIPPMMFVVAALMALPAHWLSKRHGDDFDPQLLSASFSFFNVAFFGMPVASALFGEAAVSTIICAFVGTALYGDTIGYYRVARTKEGRAKAASKALRIPLFYAFVVAVILKLSGVQAPQSLRGPADMVSTLVSILGMAVIGFNLAKVKTGETNGRVLVRILAVRQVSAVVLVAAALAIEALFVGVLGQREQILIGLIALFPIAANVSLFASLLGTREKEAATLIALSSVVALILVTAAIGLLGLVGLQG